MTTSGSRPWAARIALVLAAIAVLANATIAIVYGWLLNALFVSIETGEELTVVPGDVTSLTMPLLIVGEIWYLTPILWLATVAVALWSRTTRAAVVAIVGATVSMVAYALMLAALPRWF